MGVLKPSSWATKGGQLGATATETVVQQPPTGKTTLARENNGNA